MGGKETDEEDEEDPLKRKNAKNVHFSSFAARRSPALLQEKCIYVMMTK